MKCCPEVLVVVRQYHGVTFRFGEYAVSEENSCAPRHCLGRARCCVCLSFWWQAVKPASSRSQSAEIFVVGRKYKAPDFIDSRMLEPKHAFRQDYEVEGEGPADFAAVM